MDRFYPPDVAFEFQGPQHFRATERIAAEQVSEQRERDLIKIGLCVTLGIHMVWVTPGDLSLNGMRQKVGNLLPLRDLTGYELLIDHLESEAARARRRLERL